MFADQRHSHQQLLFFAVHRRCIVNVAVYRKAERFRQIVVGFIKQEIGDKLTCNIPDGEAVALRNGKKTLVGGEIIPPARVALYHAISRRGVHQRYARQIQQRFYVLAFVSLPDETAEFIRYHRSVYRHKEAFEVIFQHPAVAGVIRRFFTDSLLQIFHSRQRTFTHAAVETRRNELSLEMGIYALRYPRLHDTVAEHCRENLALRRPLNKERDRRKRTVIPALYLVAQFQQFPLVMNLKGYGRLRPRLVAAALLVCKHEAVVTYGDMFELVVHLFSAEIPTPPARR